MKRIVTLVACATLCITVVALNSTKTSSEETQAAESDDSPQTSSGMMHGEVRENMAAFLLCHQDRFEVGEPIPLSFGVVLVGPGLDQHDEGTISLGIRVFKPESIMDPENYSWFTVTGPDGEEVPYRGPYSSVPMYAPSDANSVVLHHGEFLRRTHSNLSDTGRFSLTRPGTYKVRWSYATHTADGVWAGGPLHSNEVTFEIVGR